MSKYPVEIRGIYWSLRIESTEGKLDLGR